jgi:hypothetical protein
MHILNTFLGRGSLRPGIFYQHESGAQEIKDGLVLLHNLENLIELVDFGCWALQLLGNLVKSLDCRFLLLIPPGGVPHKVTHHSKPMRCRPHFIRGCFVGCSLNIADLCFTIALRMKLRSPKEEQKGTLKKIIDHEVSRYWQGFT